MLFFTMQLKEIKNLFQSHPYHLVSPSPWPLYTSISLFNLTTSFVMFIHGFEFMNYVFWIAFINLVLVMSLWFRDIIAEGTFLGNHTHPVQLGLYMGVGLFIVSEVLFFLAIFWAFFHSSLSPNIELGGHWPPMGIQAINPFELPLLNTILLLSSGVTVTLAHHSFIAGDRFNALIGLILTVLLAILFTILQYVEYSVSSFSISDGAYGSCFYFGTGFHGFHVIVGTVFLLVGLYRILLYQVTQHHHLGFETGILYWHFVDVVWLFLYLSIYYWGY